MINFVTNLNNMEKIRFNTLLAMLIFSTVLIGCSTGIENTQAITLSKEDRKMVRETPEDIFLSSLSPTLLGNWQQGKPFIISDNRASMVFDVRGDMRDNKLEGKIIKYAGIDTRVTPDGKNEAVILFSDGNELYSYSTGKTIEYAKEYLSSAEVPMLIDLDLVAEASKLLVGKHAWTKTQLWYDLQGERINGRKFVNVKIDKVAPGTLVFPIKLKIIDENNMPAYLYMNIKNVGIDSRSFSNLFSLSNPKDSYRHISDNVWKLIQQGDIVVGMTKEECKLSLGNPTGVNAGHDWNSTIDLWNYSNGTYLKFQDGLLVAFRK